MFQKATLKLYFLFILALVVQTSYAKQKHTETNHIQKSDSTKAKVRSYTTKRLTTSKPKIDGVLDDACWQDGDWAGNFIQWVPKEGAKPSQTTELKVLYDDKNMYVAIRALDNEADKIQFKAGRRDEFEGDCVGVCFDSYHDHRTGFEFDVTAAGQKIDAILTNPGNADTNWNAVWYAKVSHDDKGWYTEMEIPLSQLRYSAEDLQVWGMHCWRWVGRLQEESDWETQSSTGPGILYLFGELHGIKGLKKSKRFEVMPYTVSKLKTFQKESGNPFANTGKSFDTTIGLDAKIGLSSNFTLDLTVNPDFGQVESDPSVMNLTAFETFFDEKRPFFLEGKNIFNFDVDDASVFYSRRIGQSQGFTPQLKSDEFIKMPENTTIYSAEKFSGKTSKGLTVGVIQSITANEKATINSQTGDRKEEVEPLTSYLVGRVQQDFNEGNTVIGGIFTSTNRFTNNPNFNNLNREAYTGGIDILHQWKDKEYFVDFRLIGSNIKGKPEAIARLQNSSAHYYQRSDANYLNLDSTLTRLDGYGGKVKIGKGSKGLLRYSTEVDWRSPGLDLNDVGFMQVADIVKQANNISYFVNKPVSIFRTYNISFYESNTWNFGGEYLNSGAYLNYYCEFLNKWGGNIMLDYTTRTLDTHVLRGGPAMYLPANWQGSLNFHSDGSRKASFGIGTYYSKSYNNAYDCLNVNSSISYRPLNTLKFSMNINLAKNTDQFQYVSTLDFNDQTRYILAKINQQTAGMTFRVDYNITPELSIQYYGSPFVATGKYSDFKHITNSRSNKFNDRFLEYTNPVLSGNDYQLTETNSSIADYTISNPDFNFSQFRSNLVAKWEYRPGSSVYLVWSNEQTEYTTPGVSNLLNAYNQINNSYPNNLFLIKLNYWFSI